MNNHFGDYLKTKLLERKMSQRQLAGSSGVSPSYLNYIVRGVIRRGSGEMVRPSPDIVNAIALTLNVPVDEALEAAGYDPQLIDRAAPGTIETVPDPPAVEVPDDQYLHDIAYEAVRKAIGSRLGTPAAPEHKSSPGELTIEIPGRLRVVLLDRTDELTPGEIAYYRQAFLATYDLIKK